jgi:hypothetical protein
MLSQGYLWPTPRLSQLHVPVPLWHGRIPGFSSSLFCPSPPYHVQGSPASSAPPRIETDPPPAHQLWLCAIRLRSLGETAGPGCRWPMGYSRNVSATGRRRYRRLAVIGSASAGYKSQSSTAREDEDLETSTSAYRRPFFCCSTSI